MAAVLQEHPVVARSSHRRRWPRRSCCSASERHCLPPGRWPPLRYPRRCPDNGYRRCGECATPAAASRRRHRQSAHGGSGVADDVAIDLNMEVAQLLAVAILHHPPRLGSSPLKIVKDVEAAAAGTRDLVVLQPARISISSARPRVRMRFMVYLRSTADAVRDKWCADRARWRESGC